MVVLSIGLAFLMIRIDQNTQIPSDVPFYWLYTGGADGARTILSTVAGSIITIAGVSFSITIVALSIASSQFGPRLLYNFMRDRGNQIVLGTFLATFMYSLLILLTIRGPSLPVFIPYYSITFGILLTIISVGILIYFIHHISVSINAENLIAIIERDIDDSIDRLYPARELYPWIERNLRSKEDIPGNLEEESVAVSAAKSGYLQTIDYEGLIQVAKSKDMIFRVVVRPGVFIQEGNDIVFVWPGNQVDEDIINQIQNSLILGTHRIQTQDIELAIDQLVEIALRALSPSLNGTYTAMTCVDHLGVAMASLAERSNPSAYRYDGEDHLRLIADISTFPGLMDNAFNLLRQNTRSNVAVTIRMLEALAMIAAHSSDFTKRKAIRKHADMIRRNLDQSINEDEDLRDIDQRYNAVMRILGVDPSEVD